MKLKNVMLNINCAILTFSSHLSIFLKKFRVSRQCDGAVTDINRYANYKLDSCSASKVCIYKQIKPPLVGEHAFPLTWFVCMAAHVTFGGSGGLR